MPKNELFKVPEYHFKTGPDTLTRKVKAAFARDIATQRRTELSA